MDPGFDKLVNELSACGLQYAFLRNEPAVWDAAAAKVGYLPVAYDRAMVSYQAAYTASFCDRFDDLSMILRWEDGQPIALWPLSIAWKDGSPRLGSLEAAVRPPLFVEEATERMRKSVVDRCQECVRQLCLILGLDGWASTEPLSSDGASVWHRKLMEGGATLRIHHDLYVDLSWSLEAIKANIRKSYKSLISKGNKLWQAQVLDRVEPSVFSELRELHRRVAGRVTRPQETWDLQERAINEGHAFMVLLRGHESELVGGALFHTTRSEGLYAVGVYARELFEQPLGHVVQMKAIEHLKNLGRQWYRLGYRPYAADVPAPDEKEMSIGRFKEGFSTHMRVVLQSSVPVRLETVA